MSKMENSDTKADKDNFVDDKGIDSNRSQTIQDKSKVSPDLCRYCMDYPNLGKCIIINNKTFDRSTERSGTDVDAGKVLKVFSSLGFKAKVLNNQTVSQMRQLLTSVSKEDHSQSAMFACVILSHGDESVIYGTDGTIYVEELTTVFRENQCTSLAGKPKLFFIQACNEKSNPDTETDSVGSHILNNSEVNFLYAYSTVPGIYSWRTPRSGSWFISSLCQILGEYGRELEIMRIMKRVNHKVALEFQSSSTLPGFNAMKQIPCVKSMLTKELYFPK